MMILWIILAKRIARKRGNGKTGKVRYVTMVECTRLGVRVDCFSFDYKNGTMFPLETRIHKGDGIFPSIQEWDKISDTHSGELKSRVT